ncbi:MAG: CusA/CzcA family heavy metal efflux RND transporter [Acidobacteria bacterium]|nr:CusA/CzcA family heavy metal efflux RND transporter [Acidobacteriota bacterium]
MIARIIEFSAKNRFFVFLLMTFATAWGLWSLYNVTLDAIPDLSDVQVIVFTEWPGRSPDLVEDQITYPIVAAMIAAPNVQLVRGISDFGLSYVYIIFEDGTDMYWARSRVLEYLQKITGRLPEGAAPVLGPDATGVGWVFEYALVDETGRYNLAQLRSFQDWYLRYWLESVPGVAEVASVGGFVKQYQVELDPNKLLAYNIPIGEVIRAIQDSNNDVGGRVLEVASTEYMVRGRGYIRSLEDMENVPVGVNEEGTPVYVRNLGRVQYGPDMRRGIAELDGKGEVVGGIVVMRYGQNALDVIERVKQRLADVEDSLPEGIKLVVTYDRSDLILRAVDTLKRKLTEEMIVVSIVIVVFLLHLRTAFIAILTLPVAVLLAFIPMGAMGLTANIMSLGGIAIAIGAMVDAAVILLENAHKKLEEWEKRGRAEGRADVLLEAFREVGPSLFFSLLIITVSFIPIFTLQAQEGRLFKPLAYTKTFSMGFSALLAITLVPALGTLLIRGKIHSEERHPVSRFLHWMYTPVLNLVLRFPRLFIFGALVLVLSTVPVFMQLGSEFMPPLNEGSLLFMPTAVPGMPVTEASRILQTQDKLLRRFPEVERVFGKIGRSESSTDPAPLSMVETVVLLKPQQEWEKIHQERWYSRGAPDLLKPLLRLFWPEEKLKSWEELIREMDTQLKLPGMANIWWMPVQTRTEMLATGMRSNLGVKVFGPDLETIEKIAVQIEKVLQQVPGTRSAFADRVMGGYYFDFTINRQEAARYGLTVGDVERIIETAIGGKNIGYTIEGRERYPINVRYPRELRDDIEALRRVLTPTPAGAQVPISLLAEISYTQGPPMIRDEDGQLVGYVFVDVTHEDYEGYVNQAQQIVRERVELPPGYRLEWAGQYKYLSRMKERLTYVIPATLFIIFVFLYMNFGSWKEPLIVFLAVPFSLVGSFWLLYLLDYNLSIAVWVGIIALAGLDAETGVVMLLYLLLAHRRWQAEGKMRNLADLKESIHFGAVKRVRPKVMTVMCLIGGLAPIMWASVYETGADVMKRMAAPMIGGLVTSFILELTIYPAIFLIWKGTELEGWRSLIPGLAPGHKKEEVQAPVPSKRRPWLRLLSILLGLLLAGLLVWAVWSWLQGPAERPSMELVARQEVAGIQVEILAPQGRFISGRSPFRVAFRTPQGEPVEVGDVRVEFHMPAMGTMPAMQAAANMEPAAAGEVSGQVDLPMAGEWQMRLGFDTARGRQNLRAMIRAQ